MVLQQVLVLNKFLTIFGLFRKFFFFSKNNFSKIINTSFFYFRNINIYATTIPDRMHHLDLGLFHYQIEYTIDLLGKSLEVKMNQRIAMIPRHPGLKRFSKGLQSIARLTASEYRDLMKVMVFVVDDLLLSKDLSEVYIRWNKMYLISRFERFKESDLQNFQVFINKFLNNYNFL